MPLRAHFADRTIDLPPLFRLITTREAGDAHADACAAASRLGAGTLVWTRRFDVAEFAVVLEPEEPLAAARRAFFVGMNALAATLAAEAPPEMAISFDWPDGVRIDGVLVGGARLAWPDCGEDDVPDWLVFSAVVRTAVMRAGDPGLRPLLGALDELGFREIDAGDIVAAFARHLMAGFHDWSESGFDGIAEAYLKRLPRSAGERQSLSRQGDLLTGREPGAPRRSLREALGSPSWRDPVTGMPWL